MKLAVLLSLAALGAILAPAQRPGEMRNSLNTVAVDRISVRADHAGREALCEQLRRMSGRTQDVPVLPERAELACVGKGSTTFALRLAEAPAEPDKVICELALKPSSIVFYQMRPIALRSGSTVTLPQDLSEKIQPLGVANVGDLLSSFGFVTLEIRRGEAKQPIREIGTHELPLLCKG